jgi:hypothetical protein
MTYRMWVELKDLGVDQHGVEQVTIVLGDHLVQCSVIRKVIASRTHRSYICIKGMEVFLDTFPPPGPH